MRRSGALYQVINRKERRRAEARLGNHNFEREHLEIPAGVERQLVVGEHIGAALRRREVRQDDARHLVEAEQMRGAHPAIAG